MSDFGLDNFQFKLPDPPQIEMPDMPHWYMWSDTQFEIIKDYIEAFEASLDQEHEVGLMLTNLLQHLTIVRPVLAKHGTVKLICLKKNR